MVSTTLLLAVIAFANPGAEPQAKAFRASDVRSAPPASTNAPAITPEIRGDIFMARKMYREAAEAYLEGSAGNAVLINKTGIAYHQMLQLEIAKKYYERSIKLNPKYSEALNNLGTVYYARKSYRRAVGQYKKALQFSPHSASIFSNLGTAYFARRNYDEAMKCYEKALALDPEVFEHRSSAGVLLQERTVEERAKFHYYQARLYAKQGMNDRALLCLRKALEEGLKDREKIKDEPEFAKLRELPEFQEIMAFQARVL